MDTGVETSEKGAASKSFTFQKVNETIDVFFRTRPCFALGAYSGPMEKQLVVCVLDVAINYARDAKYQRKC